MKQVHVMECGRRRTTARARSMAAGGPKILLHFMASRLDAVQLNQEKNRRDRDWCA